ncbi:MAG: hypothetical protein AAF378_10370 [Cyanobacteria bacterium P01_A01_bin.84]
MTSLLSPFFFPDCGFKVIANEWVICVTSNVLNTVLEYLPKDLSTLFALDVDIY